MHQYTNVVGIGSSSYTVLIYGLSRGEFKGRIYIRGVSHLSDRKAALAGGDYPASWYVVIIAIFQGRGAAHMRPERYHAEKEAPRDQMGT